LVGLLRGGGERLGMMIVRRGLAGRRRGMPVGGRMRGVGPDVEGRCAGIVVLKIC
jgi:hypothetical protein